MQRQLRAAVEVNVKNGAEANVRMGVEIAAEEINSN